MEKICSLSSTSNTSKVFTFARLSGRDFKQLSLIQSPFRRPTQAIASDITKRCQVLYHSFSNKFSYLLSYYFPCVESAGSRGTRLKLGVLSNDFFGAKGIEDSPGLEYLDVFSWGGYCSSKESFIWDRTFLIDFVNIFLGDDPQAS